MTSRLEVIGFNIESCIMAQMCGAHRIELCDNPAEGGTTPSYGFIKAARQVLSIELYPIIRPRGGDFLYSSLDFDIMKTDVQLCRDLNCDGVVIGLLKNDGTVDKERCHQLVELAYPMGVGFHRAFDRTNDPFKALEDIIGIGCERILTSGQQPTAMEGAKLIGELIELADGRISIMPGGGVRAVNLLSIIEKTGATQFHTSARIAVDSNMNFVNEAMHENPTVVTASAEEVKEMARLLNLQHAGAVHK